MKTAKEKGLQFDFTGAEYLHIKPKELERLGDLMERRDGGEAAREYYETLQQRADERKREES